MSGSSICIWGCRSRAEAVAAFEAVWGYVSHPEYPQHSRRGKRSGGGARVGGLMFWVWRAANGWNVELVADG